VVHGAELVMGQKCSLVYVITKKKKEKYNNIFVGKHSR